MIDDYKIKKAARQISEKVVDANGFDNSKPTHLAFLEGHIDGFNAGAKWMQEEFLKDLWHPASEKPVPVMGCNNGVLVELNETGKPITLWKREYVYENISKHGNRFISRWLDINDLLKEDKQ